MVDNIVVYFFVKFIFIPDKIYFNINAIPGIQSTKQLAQGEIGMEFGFEEVFLVQRWG